MSQATAFDASRTKVWNELVILNDVWAQHAYLFTESEERLRMLNACARWFFGSMQRLMMRDVILGISRLTDPPKTGKHANLVLASLLEDPKIGKYRGLRSQLDKAIGKVKADAAPIRYHRDKYIAHLDEPTAVEATKNPLPGIKKGLIGQIIQEMGKAYNIHGNRTRDSHAFFQLTPLGSAESLVEILESSEQWALWKKLNNEKNGI
jgi:hypothetical protein